MDFVNGTGIHRPGVFTGFEGRIMGEDVIFQYASHLRFFFTNRWGRMLACWLEEFPQRIASCTNLARGVLGANYYTTAVATGVTEIEAGHST
jgi:hypothetical protein